MTCSHNKRIYVSWTPLIVVISKCVFLTSKAIMQVGFPGLMSCVDFDMEQSSRFVGLCGILFLVSSLFCVCLCGFRNWPLWYFLLPVFCCVCVSPVDFEMEQFVVRICLCVSCNVFVGFLEGVIIPSGYLIIQSILFPEAKNTGYVSHMCQDVAAPR